MKALSQVGLVPRPRKWDGIKAVNVATNIRSTLFGYLVHRALSHPNIDVGTWEEEGRMWYKNISERLWGIVYQYGLIVLPILLFICGALCAILFLR